MGTRSFPGQPVPQGIIKKTRVSAARRLGKLVAHVSDNNLRVQSKGKGYSLTIERYTFPTSSFPVSKTVLGPSNARVNLSIFTNFECGSCRSMWPGPAPGLAAGSQQAECGHPNLPLPHRTKPTRPDPCHCCRMCRTAGQILGVFQRHFSGPVVVSTASSPAQRVDAGEARQLRVNVSAFATCLKDPAIETLI